MNPTPEEALFALALAKPAEKRPAFLDAVCEGDPALRQRLEALLAAHEQPATELAGDADRRDESHKSHESPTKDQDLTELDPPNELDETVGQTLGRYKLLERVGEGGCGVVYVADFESRHSSRDHRRLPPPRRLRPSQPRFNTGKK